MTTFTPFFFDSNNAFGLIDSPERIEWLIQSIVEHQEKGDRERAIRFILAASNAEEPEQRQIDPICAAFEHWGQVANFGYRIEHVRGTVSLEEWLRVQGMLHLVTGDPEPGSLLQ